jgi:hypothetical protein
MIASDSEDITSLESFSDSAIDSEAGSSMANISSEVGRVYDGFVIFVLLSH